MDDLDELLAGVEGRMRAERGVVASLRALPRYVRGVLASGCAAVVLGVSTLCSKAGPLLDGNALRLGLALAIAIVALHATLPSLGDTRPAGTRRLLTLGVCTLAPFAIHAPFRADLLTSGTVVGFGCAARGLVVAAPMLLIAWALARRGEDTRTRGAFLGLFSGAIGAASVELACRHHDELHALALHAPLVPLICAACALGYSERVTRWRRSR